MRIVEDKENIKKKEFTIDKYDFLPIEKGHQNMVFKAPPGAEGIEDLKVTKFTWGNLSVWKMHSIWERVKFLFKGEISLKIMGQGLPPLSIHTGDWFETKHAELSKKEGGEK